MRIRTNQKVVLPTKMAKKPDTKKDRGKAKARRAPWTRRSACPQAGQRRYEIHTEKAWTPDCLLERPTKQPGFGAHEQAHGNCGWTVSDERVNTRPNIPAGRQAPEEPSSGLQQGKQELQHIRGLVQHSPALHRRRRKPDGTNQDTRPNHATRSRSTRPFQPYQVGRPLTGRTWLKAVVQHQPQMTSSSLLAIVRQQRSG
jgi:hypothetical protein